MKIALIGATRGTGKHVLDQALERGHEVTVLARDPSKLQAAPKLRVVQGDGRNLADVEKVVQGQEVVITCIGASQLKKPEFLVSTSARPLVEAMKKHGVKRLLLLSTAGAGDSVGPIKLLLPILRLVAKPVYQTVFEDKNRAEEIVTATDLDWTLVRPPRLTDDARVGRYQTAPSKSGSKAIAKIGRADLATFMLDEAEKGQWIRGAPFVWT